jgi:hypothetical protein
MYSHFVVVADLNIDGKLDLAETNEGDNNFGVLLGNGDGTFQTARKFGTHAQPFAIAIGDFNKDGKPDLALGSAGSNPIPPTISIFLNTSR